MPKWGWFLIAGGAAYLVYQYLSAECALPTSNFYGTGLCTSFFPSQGASAVTTSAISAALPGSSSTVPASTPSGAAEQLAGYGLPPDATPSTIYPSGQNCNLVEPQQSGFNPTPGAPFYSPSTGEYYCGPANLWAQMRGIGSINRIPAFAIGGRA